MLEKCFVFLWNRRKKALDNISLEINKRENDCINHFSCQRNTLCPEVGVHGCFCSNCKMQKGCKKNKAWISVSSRTNYWGFQFLRRSQSRRFNRWDGYRERKPRKRKSFPYYDFQEDQFHGKTPFDLMDSADEKKLLSVLNLSPIPPDDVILSPKLIKH